MTAEPPVKDTIGRQARLRDALRDNLKRRKAQARGRAGQAGPRRDDDHQGVQDSGRAAADDLPERAAPNVGGERR